MDREDLNWGTNFCNQSFSGPSFDLSVSVISVRGKHLQCLIFGCPDLLCQSFEGPIFGPSYAFLGNINIKKWVDGHLDLGLSLFRLVFVQPCFFGLV